MTPNNKPGQGAGGFAGLSVGRKQYEPDPAPVEQTQSESITQPEETSNPNRDTEDPITANNSNEPVNTISLKLPDPKQRSPKRITHVTISPQIRRTTIEALDFISTNIGMSRVELIDTILGDYVEQIRSARPELLEKKRRKQT